MLCSVLIQFRFVFIVPVYCNYNKYRNIPCYCVILTPNIQYFKNQMNMFMIIHQREWSLFFFFYNYETPLIFSNQQDRHGIDQVVDEVFISMCILAHKVPFSNMFYKAPF